MLKGTLIYLSPQLFSQLALNTLLSFLTDSAHALFVRAIYLVCHRLISSWKSDVNVSLAGLELLSGLARLNIAEQGVFCGVLMPDSGIVLTVIEDFFIFFFFYPFLTLFCRWIRM